MKIHVGDLVIMNHSGWSDGWGHGIIIQVVNDYSVKVRWFDDWSDSEPVEIVDIDVLRIVSKGG